MIYLMTLLDMLLTARALNLIFAALCLWAAFGLCPRWLAMLSALLYVALAFS